MHAANERDPHSQESQDAKRAHYLAKEKLGKILRREGI